jgi:hypothetical protein
MSSQEIEMRIKTRDIEVVPNHFMDEDALRKHAYAFYAEQFGKGRVVNDAMIDIECRFSKFDRFQCEAFRAFCHQLDTDIDNGELNFKWREHNSYNRRFDYENKPMRKGVVKIHNTSNLHLREKEVKNPKPYEFRAYCGAKLVYNGNVKAHFQTWLGKYKKQGHVQTRHVVFKNHSETYFRPR